MSKRLQTAHKIIRHAEVESLRIVHLQRQISLPLTLTLLDAPELKLAVISHVVANQLLKDFINARRKQMHSEPAEEDIVRQSINPQLRSRHIHRRLLDDQRNIDQSRFTRATLARDRAKAFELA